MATVCKCFFILYLYFPDHAHFPDRSADFDALWLKRHNLALECAFRDLTDDNFLGVSVWKQLAHLLRVGTEISTLRFFRESQGQSIGKT